MRLYGISMVRNEADIIRVNVLYHLSVGFDRLLIFDDGSEDGTERVLKDLSSDTRVRWTRGTNNDFRQGEVFTGLAREAYRAGADWVMPVDADEFWRARRGSIKQVLAATDAVALQVDTIDFIQRRNQRKSSPDALLHMTRRVENTVPRERARELLDQGKTSYVEMTRVPKWIFRPSASVSLERGAHRVEGIEGPRERTDEIFILHAPLRSREILEAKALSASRRGRRKPGTGLGPGWLYTRWQEVREGSGLGEEWAANSYEDGCLDIYGELHPVIFDPTLRDAVAPFIEQRPLWRRAVEELSPFPRLRRFNPV